MTSDRWPELPVLGSAILPSMADGSGELWPEVLTVATNLPPDHMLIRGVMVFRRPARPSRFPPAAKPFGTVSSFTPPTKSRPPTS